jgi:hypothetical protein
MILRCLLRVTREHDGFSAGVEGNQGIVQAPLAFALNPHGPLRCPIQLATYRVQWYCSLPRKAACEATLHRQTCKLNANLQKEKGG